MLERVRERQNKRKAEEADDDLKPSKLVCEREERIAKVQLKAYWECFPLAGSFGSESSCNGGSVAAGPSRTDAQFKPKGTERKQLLARLKGSIEENVKRRKVEELPKVQVNSNTGKDQKESDLGTKVRLGGDDRSATESSSTGVQPSTNKGEHSWYRCQNCTGECNQKGSSVYYESHPGRQSQDDKDEELIKMASLRASTRLKLKCSPLMPGKDFRMQ